MRNEASVTTLPTTQPLNYALINVDATTVGIANRYAHSADPAFDRFVGSARSADVPVGVGDVVTLTIFEASSGGLFIPSEAGSRAGNFIATPPQQVDAAGTINVPYAGTIHVAGLKPQAISRTVQNLLKSRAIEPQVLVTVNERNSNEINVLGEVGAPARFPMQPGGIRLLEAIARAGGPKYPPYDTIVTVQRKGRTEKVIMSSAVANPSQDIQLQNGDVVYLTQEPKIFMAFGATPPPGAVGGINSRRFTFDNTRVTLAEGVAKAGGLSQDRADASAVFLFRNESPQALADLGVDASRFTTAKIPTVYQFDLSRSDNLFLINEFNMKDRDVIFVSEAPSTELSRFVGSLSGVTGSFADVGSGVSNIR